MEITVPFWAGIAFATVIVWLVAMLFPMDDRYGLGRFLAVCAAVIVTLVLWLIFFAVT